MFLCHPIKKWLVSTNQPTYFIYFFYNFFDSADETNLYEIKSRRLRFRILTRFIFLGIRKTPTWKLPPGKFPPSKLPPGKFPPGKFPPRKFPPGIFPPMFLTIPTRFLSFLFFHYCHRHHWCYLKDCLVSAEVRNSAVDVSKKM